MNFRARSTQANHVVLEVVDSIIARNSLHQLGMSVDLYGGSCPFCGYEKSFIVWRRAGLFRCFYCGCDGRFVRSPERKMAEERERIEREKHGAAAPARVGDGG